MAAGGQVLLSAGEVRGRDQATQLHQLALVGLRRRLLRILGVLLLLSFELCHDVRVDLKLVLLFLQHGRLWWPHFCAL